MPSEQGRDGGGCGYERAVCFFILSRRVRVPWYAGATRAAGVGVGEVVVVVVPVPVPVAAAGGVGLVWPAGRGVGRGGGGGGAGRLEQRHGSRGPLDMGDSARYAVDGDGP